MSRNSGLSAPGLEDVLTLLAAGAAAQQQANAQNADGSPFTAPFGLLGGGLAGGGLVRCSGAPHCRPWLVWEAECLCGAHSICFLTPHCVSASQDLQSLLALHPQYSLPLLMSSAHVNGGAAGQLPGGLALPSVPSSDLPKLLSLDLAALQQQADKKQPADAAANNAAAALLMSRQGSDRGGPSRQADGAGPSSRMRRAPRSRDMESDEEDGSDEDRSSLTGEGCWALTGEGRAIATRWGTCGLRWLLSIH